MAFQHIELGQLLGGDIVDGRGDGPLAVKRGRIAVRIQVRVADVDVVVADKAAAVAAFHHQAVVGHVLVGVGLGKGGVDVGVALDDADMAGQCLVFREQVLDDLVLLAGLDDPVDRDVLVQRVDDDLGVGRDGVELGGADIILCQVGGQRRGQQVDGDEQRQRHGRDRQRVAAAQHRRAPFLGRGGRLPGGVFFGKQHQLYLLFSSDWTDKNRKNAATER